MQRVPRDTASAFAMLCTAYLSPEALWYYTIVDRRERTIFTTANRHYLAFDEQPVELALDEILRRWEEHDPDLLVVPRMPNEERAQHMAALIASIADPTIHSALEKDRTWVLAHWDDVWRPGSLENFAEATDEETNREWRRRLGGEASASIGTWLEAHRMTLVGMSSLTFE